MPQEGSTEMDGSTASLIAVPIVVTLSLVAWLILVAYAAAHPQWKHGAPATRADGQFRPVGPRLADRIPADADHGASVDERAKLAA
jgi:hypothetical protein